VLQEGVQRATRADVLPLGVHLLVVQRLAVDTLVDEEALGLLVGVLGLGQVREPPLVRHVHSLTAGEFELGTSEGLACAGHTDSGVLGADGHDDLSDVHTSGGTRRLTEGTTHTGLETIGTSARKHFVDAQDLEGVHADAHVEGVLATDFDHPLVRGDTSGFEGLGRELLALERHHVHARGELVDIRALAPDVVDADTRIRDTTAVARLGVRLPLAVAVATSGTAAHGCETFSYSARVR